MKNSKEQRIANKRKRGAEGKGTSKYALKTHGKSTKAKARNEGYINPNSPFKVSE